jgi:hypothetical protein
MEDDHEEEDDEEDKQIEKSSKKKNKNYTIDDIMNLDSQLHIGKKKKKEEPTITKAISKYPKKKHCKKSQKLMRF